MEEDLILQFNERFRAMEERLYIQETDIKMLVNEVHFLRNKIKKMTEDDGR